MNTVFRFALALAALIPCAQASAQAVFYQQPQFEGGRFDTRDPVREIDRRGFRDRAQSVVVVSEPWEVCDGDRFSGRCAVLRPGRYPSVESMGLQGAVASGRSMTDREPIDENRYAPPPPVAVYDNHRRNYERLYQADVTSVHAVVSQAEQRCWVEREQVTDRRDNRVPGALAGAVLGGILGHQIGGGSGRDIATVGGAAAGAAVGYHVAGGGETSRSADVQHCAAAPEAARADYWDVTYDFRGEQHRIQMTSPPGRTVTVNQRGEPRA